MFLLNRLRRLSSKDDEAEIELLHEFENHAEHEQSMQDTQGVHGGGEAALAHAAWQWKLVAVITALMLPVGSHFSNTALNAMKSSIKDHLNIDNTRYGVLASSVTLINSLFPVLGGYAMDRFGSARSTLVVSALILCGSFCTAVAAEWRSFPLMVLSRVLFGMGSGLIVTMQESLLSKWFQTSGLASLVIGIQLTTSRLASFVGMLVANLVAEQTGNWVWPFWIAFILCLFSILMNGVYTLVVMHVTRPATATAVSTLATQNNKERTHHHPSLLSTALQFPDFYWAILGIEFMYSAVWSSFITISAELVQTRSEDISGRSAGYQASMALIVPVIGSPLVGMFMDKFGHRVTMLFLSTVFLIGNIILLGWVPAAHAVIGMILFSFSLTLGPIAMITSIGMLLPSRFIGLGLGLFKSANSTGTTLLDILVGVIQDKTEHQSYSGVMILYVSLGTFGLVLTGFLFGAQRIHLDNLLQAGRERRVKCMRAKYALELQSLQQPHENDDDNASFPETENSATAATLHFTSVKRRNYVFLGVLVAAILAAWALFFIYAVSSDREASDLSNKQGNSP
ncbi:major facilitator superfamily domain-containing protein [Dichotomocladium elegans]|nr:major facilitator superfamily domain-containing protein [Dichotomocladium elegans]